MYLRVAVISNGIGQGQRLSYLSEIQMKIEQGNSPVTTVCMHKCLIQIGLTKETVKKRKSLYYIDVKTCRTCGGAVKLITCIEEPVVIKKILMHLEEKLPTRAALLLPDSRAPPQSSLFG